MSNITAKTKICMIIGDPVEHSLSPQIHNAAYKALGIDNEFVFLAANVKPENLQNAILGMRALQIRGITVTHPHKLAVMQYLDIIDETAKKIGAVNTIVNHNGKLMGSNTDWIGVVDSLEEKTPLKGKSVALIGSGGAARAALYGVLVKGANATVFNRTREHAEKLAKEFHCSYGSLEEQEKIKKMDIIIQLTSMGNISLVDRNTLKSSHIVFDAIYSPYETKFLHDAKENGAIIIHGTAWLLYQGLAQFEIYTGKKAPRNVMEQAIINNLRIKNL